MLRAKQNRSYWRNQQCRCVHDSMLKSLTAASLMQLRNDATRQHDSYSRLILSRRHSQSEQSSIESIGSKRASAKNCASAKNQNRISKSCVPHSCAVLKTVDFCSLRRTWLSRGSTVTTHKSIRNIHFVRNAELLSHCNALQISSMKLY